ncbi:MAG: type 4a pilus biogenesis protein PilO [Deltaproteobacteria bacterium]|nr:type 4a pilus biogenesis protein PilO [Deltaproteobacteria bacterium]
MDLKDLKEKIGEYRELIIILTTAVAIGFFFYQYIYLKNAAEIQRLDSQAQTIAADINKVSAEAQATQQTAQRLKDAMGRLKEMEEKFMITQSKLPSERQLSSILKGLVGGEAKRGIKFTSLKPLPLEQKGEYFKLPFQITMQGRFQAFGEYLERIEDMPRIITVENFRLDAKEESLPLLSIQLFMNTYVLGGQ